MPTNRNQQNDNTQGSGKSSMHGSIRGSESSSGRSSGQQASGQRRPDHQPDAFGLQHRHDLAFEVAPGDGVVRLQRGELLQPQPLGNAERLHDLPGRPVGHADVARAAGADDVVQGPQRFLHRGLRIPPVDLVEVDVVGPQPLKAGVDLVHQVIATDPRIVGPVAHREPALAGDHHLLGLGRPRLEPAPDDLFRHAARIDVRRIDEIAACPGIGIHQRERGRLVRLAAERHRPQAPRRNDGAAVSKSPEFHD